MITVSISGKAWYSQAFANDPHYLVSQSETKDLDESYVAMLKNAKVTKRGKGHTAKITGSKEDLIHLAEWLHCDGDAWAHFSGDDPYTKSEGKACLKASDQIMKAVGERPLTLRDFYNP